ncbi:MAG TPA: alpha/beta fold hydrolase [Mycobacteriales bacterium]|nr:alpha/beta fold hydrolase [Mycobacteriales bacterium]
MPGVADSQVERFVTHDGLSLAYTVDGDGPTVVLLHGMTADSRINWQDPGIAAALVQAGWRVVLLDARGHGSSDRRAEIELHERHRHAGDLVALLDHLEVGTCAAVGYSLGATTVALALPDEPRISVAVLAGIGLASIDPYPGGPETDAVLAALDADTDDDVEPMLRPYREHLRSWDASFDVAAATLRALQRPTTFHLDRIAAPVLVLNGSDDAPASELADRIPGARQRTVPGAHGTAPLEPDFVAAVLEFLDEHRGALTDRGGPVPAR